MKKFRMAILAGAVFILALVNGSGWGIAHNTEFYMYLLLGAYSSAVFLRRTRVDSSYLRTVAAPVIVLFVYALFMSMLRGHSLHAIKLMMPFGVTYFFSHFSVNNDDANYIGLTMLSGSMLLLFIYTQTEILRGWNENTIAMLAYFGYSCYVSMNMYSSRRIPLVLFSFAFIVLLMQTASRTSIICVMLLLLASFFRERTAMACESKKYHDVILHFALLFAIIIALVGSSSLIIPLDMWSYRHLRKTFFNGRDALALQGLTKLMETGFLGPGYFLKVNWHNWAISLLASYGMIGYIFWVRIIRYITETGRRNVGDGIVLGLLASILLVFIQQSTELGLVGESNVNVIPYMMFGLLLGRVKYLDKQRLKGDGSGVQSKHHYSCL